MVGETMCIVMKVIHGLCLESDIMFSIPMLHLANVYKRKHVFLKKSFTGRRQCVVLRDLV